MRNVNPDDLDQLAKLLDGQGGMTEKLDEAFTRASTLGVSHRLGSLKPMQTWIAETPSDLRNRATIARKDQLFERGHRETYSDWLIRVEAHYLARVPGLEGIGERDIEAFLKRSSDALSTVKVGGITVGSGVALTTTLFRNSWYNGMLRTTVDSSWWTRGGAVRSWAGAGLRSVPAGALRSLSAPGSWLPGQLGNAFNRSSLYQTSTRIPFTSTMRNTWLGYGWDHLRTRPVMNSPFVTKAVDSLIGSDALAVRYGGTTHSGLMAARAGQTSLSRVFRSASYFQQLNNARPSVVAAGKTASPFLKGLGTAAKTGGYLRVAGIGASAFATVASGANVWAQGNPKEAFKAKGAGYVADVAEVGFNASLTAAMIAPNPVTVGLAVGTGLIYGGAKVVEHLPEIKASGKEAIDWVGDKASKAKDNLVDSAKSAAKAANPMNWF